MWPFDDDSAILIQLGFQCAQCFQKSSILSRIFVKRQHINIIKEIIPQERILDLHEQGADAVMARTTRRASFPVLKQRLHRVTEQGQV